MLICWKKPECRSKQSVAKVMEDLVKTYQSSDKLQAALVDILAREKQRWPAMRCSPNCICRGTAQDARLHLEQICRIHCHQVGTLAQLTLKKA